MSGEALVTVLETPDEVELQLACDLLLQAGIPCAVEQGGAASYVTAVLGSAGFAGVRALRVRAADEERALDVLEAAWGEQGEDGQAS